MESGWLNSVNFLQLITYSLATNNSGDSADYCYIWPKPISRI